MMKLKLKKPIRIVVSAAIALITVAIVFFALRTKPQADPAALLGRAERLSEQNLCLMALLEQEDENEEYLRQLLLNYQLLGADPLTIQATRGEAQITLPESVTLQKEQAGELMGGGLIQFGIRYTDYPDTNAVATDGTTVYLAKQDGIYVDYKGLTVKISPARADQLMAAENGLYFRNTVTKRVHYLARDGHRTETLSAVPVHSFAFCNGSLWTAGTDGGLYQDNALFEGNLGLTELCAVGGRLFAASAEGILEITENGTEYRLPSPASYLTAGNGVLYYIDENRYPARFDFKKNEASVLKEKTALALEFDEDKLYYMNQKEKMKVLKK